MSVAMAIMYQKPENCKGIGRGQCWSYHTMLPVQAPSQKTDSVSDPFPRPTSHLCLQVSTILSQARLKRAGAWLVKCPSG